MVKLIISASEEDGMLQRAIFEFSKRNIEIQRLIYSKEGEHVQIHITVGNAADAGRVLSRLRKIGGVTAVDAAFAEIHSTVPAREIVSPQEMLG